jgi:hypothetical protein
MASSRFSCYRGSSPVDAAPVAVATDAAAPKVAAPMATSLLFFHLNILYILMYFDF